MFVITGSCPSSPVGWPGGTHTSEGGRVALWQLLTGGERRLARGPAVPRSRGERLRCWPCAGMLAVTCKSSRCRRLRWFRPGS